MFIFSIFPIKLLFCFWTSTSVQFSDWITKKRCHKRNILCTSTSKYFFLAYKKIEYQHVFGSFQRPEVSTRLSKTRNLRVAPELETRLGNTISYECGLHFKLKIKITVPQWKCLRENTWDSYFSWMSRVLHVVILQPTVFDKWKIMWREMSSKVIAMSFSPLYYKKSTSWLLLGFLPIHPNSFHILFN